MTGNSNKPSQDEEARRRALELQRGYEASLADAERVVADSLVPPKHLQERHAAQSGTKYEAHEQIQLWLRTKRENDRVRRDSQDTNPTSERNVEMTSALVAPPSAGALIGAPLSSVSRTPIEDMRRSKGIDRLRTRLYGRLLGQISVEDGVAQIGEWMALHAGCECSTLEQVKKFFPDLAVSEIAFFPLLKNLPDTIKLCGSKGFDAVDAYLREHPAADVEQLPNDDERNSFPAQLEFRVDGLTYGTDLSPLYSQTYSAREPEPDADDPPPITSSPVGREVVEWLPEVASDIEDLILLTIESPRIFAILRERMDDSLLVGVSRIRDAAHAFAHRAKGEIALPVPEHREKSLEEIEQMFADRVIRAELTYDNSERISFEELVHIVGLLGDVPACLLQNEPFQGTVLFYLDSILFADSEGIIQEECPLDGECRSRVRIAFFEEGMESSDTNETMLQVERELKSRAYGKLFSQFLSPKVDLETANRNLSQTEAIGVRVLEEHGIRFRTLGDREVVEVGTSHQSKAPATLSRGGTQASFSLKFSHEEAELIASVLDRLTPEALKNITAISKVQAKSAAELDMQGGGLAGVRRSSDGEIEILEPFGFAYSELSNGARLERAYLVAHAVGESLYSELSREEMGFWFDRFNHRELRDPNGFVSLRGMDSPSADFASHFAAYVLCPNEFLACTINNDELKAKYEMIQHVAQRLGLDLPRLQEQALPFPAPFEAIREQLGVDLRDPEAVLKAMEDRFAQQRKEAARLVDEGDMSLEAHPLDLRKDEEDDALVLRERRRVNIRASLLSTFEEVEGSEDFEDFVRDFLEIVESSEADKEEEVRDLAEEYEDFFHECDEDPGDYLVSLFEELQDLDGA